MIPDPIAQSEGFEWDEHNVHKLWERHKVLPLEAEEAFFNDPLVVADDAKHSATEKRFYALGRTMGGRMLFLAFTIRRKRIRVISARDMSRKERAAYHKL